MRIQTHPDRLLKPGMAESEKEKIKARSARVGQAHQLLKDPAQVCTRLAISLKRRLTGV